MRIRHLDCGTMRAPLAGTMVCHVLVLEYDDRVVLVDSGLGVADLERPERLGLAGRLLPATGGVAGTARRQLEALGTDPASVSDIVLTHLDFDHAGGMADFPDARVHVTSDEKRAAVTPRWRDRMRYRTAQWAYGPTWQTYAGRGDDWREGLTAHAVEGIDGVALVPLPGHSEGHACVVVERSDGTLLVHAGDAAFDASVYATCAADGTRLDRWRLLRAFETSIAADRRSIAGNHRTLRALDATEDTTVINAHDPRIFAAVSSGGP